MQLSNISRQAFESYLDSFIDRAFNEDFAQGDHTSMATIPQDRHGKAYLLVKESCYMAGIALAEHIFEKMDAQIKVKQCKQDGEWTEEGEVAFDVEGPYRSILTAERIVINCMQHLSGITTKTRYLNDLLPTDSHAQLLDTRKTTPGLRFLEKWAVELGGGKNHRMGLSDMIMIKDNHIDFSGNITKAVNRVYEYQLENRLDLPIVVETRSMEEVQEGLDTGKVDRILLDNMSSSMVSRAVQFINGRIPTEASGNIDAHNIADYADTGVDYISTSALTRNIWHKDLSLKFDG